MLGLRLLTVAGLVANSLALPVLLEISFGNGPRPITSSTSSSAPPDLAEDNGLFAINFVLPPSTPLELALQRYGSFSCVEPDTAENVPVGIAVETEPLFCAMQAISIDGMGDVLEVLCKSGEMSTNPCSIACTSTATFSGKQMTKFEIRGHK